MKVVDLSADFRVSQSRNERYYQPHEAPGLLARPCTGCRSSTARRSARRRSWLGCGLLPDGRAVRLWPLRELMRDAIVDAKSGVSGAGREATGTTHFVSADAARRRLSDLRERDRFASREKADQALHRIHLRDPVRRARIFRHRRRRASGAGRFAIVLFQMGLIFPDQRAAEHFYRGMSARAHGGADDFHPFGRCPAQCPARFQGGLLRLGREPAQTIGRVLVPASLSGIVSAVLLGLAASSAKPWSSCSAREPIAIPDFTQGLGAIFSPVHTMTESSRRKWAKWCAGARITARFSWWAWCSS